MEKNEELRLAWEFVEHTGKSVFLTGKAGTGKTTFLKTLREKSHKRLVVVAPTGVAAINAGGVTIHSFFQLSLSPYLPNTRLGQKFSYSKEKRKMIRTLDVLVIDEISMVRSDVLDAVDSVMRRFREHDKPFGGVQLLMIGDLHQLTPVARPGEEELLAQYYSTPYFFGSKALAGIDYVTIELNHVYRQHDDAFLDILNDIRNGQATRQDLQTLNSRCRPDFRPRPGEGYIRLTTHNRLADNYNAREMLLLPGPAATFDAEVEGDFPEGDFPTDRSLVLKAGAQVMFLKNDAGGRFYNGRIGQVASVGPHKILVRCPGDDTAIDVARETWENTKYRLDEASGQIRSEVVGTFTQYPLRLAWAITVHKSQGLTFDRAIVDVRQAFASGQVYVALSRCKALDGLVLASPIAPQAIINDPRVAEYTARQEPATRDSIRRLPRLKEEYYRQLVADLFNLRPIALAEAALDRVMQEFLFGKTPLAALHHTALGELNGRLLPVAAKWLRVIAETDGGQLREAPFLERVGRSATYFAGQLSDILGELLKRTADLDVANKAVKKRLDHAYDDLHDVWLAKLYLLQSVAAHGFTPQSYLEFKQQAVLKAMGAETERPAKAKAKARTAARKDKKKPAQPKADTRQASMDLYRQGMTIGQIAQERNLKPDTIMGHLAHYVLDGQLPVDAVMPREHHQEILRVIKKTGTADGMKPIKALCPAEVTFNEIKLVIDLLRGKRVPK